MKFSEFLSKKRAEINISQRELAQLLGVTVRSVSGWESGAYEPHATMKERIKEFFADYPEAWMEVPEEENPNYKVFRVLKRKGGKHEWEGIPMYKSFEPMLITDKENPTIFKPDFYIPEEALGVCDFGAKINDNYLSPEINSGDYVFCKEISIDNVVHGDMYIIYTSDHIEYARYAAPAANNDSVKILSNNEKYPDTEMKKKNIRKIFKVRGVLRSF